ncbi:uncharacterized protein LOC111406136 isoform X2 [Olea europaea var. sylvestris]|uniref:uncharacterized protein LOC111406136 isoform X2 n=1 Tax=Olea europaea var. sylvestris TaxID=158386 RepID=UPI000C1D6BD9|nr:uncharacterized protein LOC111406136 isoform X2 [Olea europaea var. sylvestris]
MGNISSVKSKSEPKQFNDFLHHLVKFCQEKDLKSFGEYASLEITLVSKQEAPDSEVYQDDARSFIKGARSRARIVRIGLVASSLKWAREIHSDILMIYSLLLSLICIDFNRNHAKQWI